jgi:exopolyphosphatase/guanosine-5'-triphosphate,3'-diphosphate pyrophosphatase
VSSLFLSDASAPVSSDLYALIQRNVRVAAVRALQQVRRHRIDLAMGSSGTIENLAEIAARMFNRRKRDRDGVLTHEHLKQVVKVLSELPLDKRRQVPGINPERADIIIGGAAVLDTLMQELQVSEIAISDRGLRDGLLMDYLSRRQPDYWQMSCAYAAFCNWVDVRFRRGARTECGAGARLADSPASRICRWARRTRVAALRGNFARRGRISFVQQSPCAQYYIINNAEMLG